MPGDYSVYVHVFPDGKKYIGVSKDPQKRWKSNGSGYISNHEMYRAICKYGWDNIEHNVVETGLTREEAKAKERELINEHNSIKNGFNKSPGGALSSCLYSKHVMQMIRMLKRFHYLHEDFLPTAKRMLDLSDDEGLAYQVNLIDYVMRTEVDGYSHGLAYRMGDSMYETFDWYYYIGHWTLHPEKDIRLIPGPLEYYHKLLDKQSIEIYERWIKT